VGLQDENWKSSKELIRTLVETASKGGNFLLNVGPTPEGLIPQASVERLEAIGRWMAVNRESIYGTTASPIGRPEWGYCTAKGDRLYLHVTEWPSDGKLPVKLPNAGAAKAHLLADKKKKALPVVCQDGKVTVSVPGEAPDAVDSVVVLTVNNK
jgi:alpha-L-fucosidase